MKTLSIPRDCRRTDDSALSVNELCAANSVTNVELRLACDHTSTLTIVCSQSDRLCGLVVTVPGC
jgi:hypothetical protein